MTTNQQTPTRQNCELCDASVPAHDYAKHLEFCRAYREELAEGQRRGAMIAALLGLKCSCKHSRLYDTSHGKKSDLGLYRTVKGIIDGTLTVAL